MLRLDRLRIVLGDFALSADLAIPAGSRTAVIGPSGAGKSTLLDAIAGFVAPASGRVLWQDRDITALPPGDRPLSLIFQDNNLFPHLTVRQNAGLGLSPSLRLTAADRDRVADGLARVGLAGLGDRRPAELSGGQRGRVALARMLLRDRPLALLDEPFAALGPALKDEMLDLLARLADDAGTTLLIVSHDPGDARRIADRTVVVADGRAEPPRDTAALLADPPPALRDYLGARHDPARR